MRTNYEMSQNMKLFLKINLKNLFYFFSLKNNYNKQLYKQPYKKIATMDEVPDDIQCLILKNINLFVFKKLRLVCQNWKTLFETDSLIWNDKFITIQLKRQLNYFKYNNCTQFYPLQYVTIINTPCEITFGRQENNVTQSPYISARLEKRQQAKFQCIPEIFDNKYKIISNDLNGIGKYLKILYIYGTIDNIDFLQDAYNLKILYCNGFNRSMDSLKKCKNLEILFCAETHISDNELINLTKLKILECSNCYYITEKSVSKLVNIEELYCNQTSINFMNIEPLSHLRILHCVDNPTIKTIDKFEKLQKIDCENIQFDKIENETSLRKEPEYHGRDRYKYREKMDKYREKMEKIVHGKIEEIYNNYGIRFLFQILDNAPIAIYDPTINNIYYFKNKKHMKKFYKKYGDPFKIFNYQSYIIKTRDEQPALYRCPPPLLSLRYCSYVGYDDNIFQNIPVNPENVKQITNINCNELISIDEIIETNKEKMNLNKYELCNHVFSVDEEGRPYNFNIFGDRVYAEFVVEEGHKVIYKNVNGREVKQTFYKTRLTEQQDGLKLGEEIIMDFDKEEDLMDYGGTRVIQVVPPRLMEQQEEFDQGEDLMDFGGTRVVQVVPPRLMEQQEEFDQGEDVMDFGEEVIKYKPIIIKERPK